jgi:hypothetical protein
MSCEWMYGDAAAGALGFNELAHLNPLRWSGSLSFEKAISALEAELSKGSRPILVKVPAGVKSTAKRFEATEVALDYLRNLVVKRETEKKAVDAVKVATEAKNAAVEAVKVATEAKDAAESAAAALREEVHSHETTISKAKAEAADAGNVANETMLAFENVCSDVKGEWMFGDAGGKPFGIHFAKMNPMRWSGGLHVIECIRQLQDVQKQSEAATREILVRVPPGTSGKEMPFSNCAEALAYFEGLCPARNKAREDCDAANTANQAAEAKVADAEAAAAETNKKLEAVVVTVSEAAERLEIAKTDEAQAEDILERANAHAAEVKAEMEESSKSP